MRKIKQILAIIGIVLLVGLYVSTLIFALLKSEFAADMLKVSIFATTMVPIMLYAFSLAYKLWGRGKDKKDKEQK